MEITQEQVERFDALLEEAELSPIDFDLESTPNHATDRSGNAECVTVIHLRGGRRVTYESNDDGSWLQKFERDLKAKTFVASAAT